MGKRKVLSESYLKELVLPEEGQLLGRVIKLVGGDNVVVKCNDQYKNLPYQWKDQKENVDQGK